MTHELTPHPCKVKKQMTMERKEMTNQDLPEPDWDDMDDEFEFIPCGRCDGHPACEDFGCAYEFGKGNMVKQDKTKDWDQ